jgi:hypothetical protein
MWVDFHWYSRDGDKQKHKETISSFYPYNPIQNIFKRNAQ